MVTKPHAATKPFTTNAIGAEYTMSVLNGASKNTTRLLAPGAYAAVIVSGDALATWRANAGAFAPMCWIEPSFTIV